LPHASIAVNVLVCERPHPLLCNVPSEDETVGVLHASVAVAVPSAPFISPADGLHPSVVVVPPVVIVGGVTSAVHVTVLDAVDVLLQASIANHDLVCERAQALLDTEPSLTDMVGTPQASVAAAVPRAPFISPAEGLHPSVVVVPPVVIVGGVSSAVHVTVLDAADVLLQASLAVNVLVCERAHPLLDTDPSLELTVGVLTASVAVAVPSAAFISPTDGLQAKVNVVPPVVIVGAVASTKTVGCGVGAGYGSVEKFLPLKAVVVHSYEPLTDGDVTVIKIVSV
jgi:hypothetical protein